MSKRIIFLTLVLTLVMTGLVTADQNLFISKKVRNKIHMFPHIAVNLNNGYLLVVWSTAHPTNYNYGRTWAAIVKKKPSGKYKVLKPRMISPDSGYHFNIRAAWIPGNEEFLVVWDDYNFWASLSNPQPSSIWAQKVNGQNGQLVGDRMELIADENINFAPYVFADFFEGSLDINRYVSRFDKKSLPSTQGFEEKSKVVYYALHNFYEPMGSGTALVVKERDKTLPEDNVERVVRVPNSENCFLILYKESYGGDFIYSILLKKDGVIVDRVGLMAHFSPMFLNQGNKMVLFTTLIN